MAGSGFFNWYPDSDTFLTLRVLQPPGGLWHTSGYLRKSDRIRIAISNAYFILRQQLLEISYTQREYIYSLWLYGKKCSIYFGSGCSD